MAKIIDFQEAKKKIRANTEKSKKYFQYIKEQEKLIDSISDLIIKKLRDVYVCENPEEHLRRVSEMKELTKAFNAVLSRIEKAGIEQRDKTILKLKAQEKTVKIETIREAYENLFNDIIKSEIIPIERIKEKRDKKRKAIRINTRRNVR